MNIFYFSTNCVSVEIGTTTEPSSLPIDKNVFNEVYNRRMILRFWIQISTISPIFKLEYKLSFDALSKRTVVEK